MNEPNYGAHLGGQAVKPTAPIQSRLEKVSTAIDRMVKATQELERRLEPILVPQCESGNKECGAAPTPQASSFSHNLDTMKERADYGANLIDKMLGRIEI